MNGPSDRDVEILAEALGLPSAQRADYLDRACGDDAALRRKVEALLRAHEQAGDFLKEPAAGLAIVREKENATCENAGDRIGRYKLLQQIGEGGCGVVFMAEQQEPVRRRVALKLIKPGMDTRSVIARFEAERQALALMDHPSIAQVFDAGATARGRPYFVMELVKGIRITDYCDRNLLATSARLILFVQVCDAVQHAHQKGIIHRDLKPSNILVTTTAEGKALPKIIDFGIAKATTGQQLTDKTLFTAFEMLIGTPAYMSPEQADIASVDVDTRTDIYSLGVLLYELLTGSTPFDNAELFKAGLDEIRRVIREQEPAAPSTRLSRMSKADLTAVAQHRQSEPPRLIHAIRGDLDWIVMKAMDKDRTRRYQTAYGLALDVQRFLADEAITARPPSVLYKWQKTARRHKVLFVSLSSIALLLIVSLIVVSTSLARERKAHREAQVVKGFLEDMLKSVAPSVALGQDTTMLRGILDRTAKRIGTEMANQPRDEAELRDLIGQVYYELEQFVQAEQMFRGALAINRNLFGSESKAVATTLNNLGTAIYKQGNLPEAERAHREALAIRKKLFGNENLEVATSLNNLAGIYRKWQRNPEAEAMIREALRIRRKLLANDDLDTAYALENLSLLLNGKGKFAESEKLEREVLAIRKRLSKDDLQVAAALVNVAWPAARQDKWNDVEALHREALTIRRRLLGDGHASTMSSLLLLCEALEQERKFGEAEELLNKELTPAIIAQPSSARLLAARADLLGRQRRWREAAADAAIAVEHQPADHNYYHLLAPLLAITHNLPAYEQLCRRILATFSNTTNLNIADRMAKDCLLLQQSGVDLILVGKLADTAVTATSDNPSMPFFQACKALSEYRLGHFAEAVSWAQKLPDSSRDEAKAYADAVLAMAHWQLGHRDEARAMLAKGNSLVTAVSVKRADDLGDVWGNWLFARISLDEAAALIQSGTMTGNDLNPIQ